VKPAPSPALNHPNIVTVYSVEEDQGVIFITMELVEGRTLAEGIPAGGMPLGDLLRLAIPLTDAVSAAHRRGSRTATSSRGT
jgi:serine/threonine-protein kinase